MRLHRCVSVLFLSCVSLILLPNEAFAQSNLLQNPGFQNGLTGWRTVQSQASTVSYGALEFPSALVAATIGGRGRMARDDGGNAVLEQEVPLGNVAGRNLFASGYFGGNYDDDARLVVRFLDAAGNEMRRDPLPYVTRDARNGEVVLVRREAILGIPAGATHAVARVEFRNACCGVITGAADEIELSLTTAPVIPAARSMNTELVVNGTFEHGWTYGSPLTLNEADGWFLYSGRADVRPYGTQGAPSASVSTIIGASAGGLAGSVLSHSGNAILGQIIDVRGNAAQFATGQVALALSAYLGGMNTVGDTARVDAYFLTSSGAALGTASLLPVGRDERNQESVLMRREGEWIVPRGTAFIEVDITFQDDCCGVSQGLVDQVSAQFVTPSSPRPQPLDVNLVLNGSFESGSLPGSPLQLTEPRGWRGAHLQTLQYGTWSHVPDPSFAASNGLGGQLLNGVAGQAILSQSIDLRGNQSAIQNGRLRASASAWLGGSGSIGDQAEVWIRFHTLAGTPVGSVEVLGPVTPGDRQNQTTLLLRTADFPVPTQASHATIEIRFTDVCCGVSTGTADDVRFLMYDVLRGNPSLYPGTGDDFRLATGIDGPPSTGLGYQVKLATSNQVLNLRLDSPLGSFDWRPLAVLATVRIGPGSGMSNAGIAIDPGNFLVLWNGLGCSGFGCPSVLPGGTFLNLPIPPGLSGMSILIQGVTFGPAATNGLYATSEGHEIRIQ